MSVDFVKLKRALACSLLATGLVLATGVGSALTAEQPSVDQIIKALKPNLTRSLTTSPAESARNADEPQFLDTLRNRTTRSLTLNEREKIATFVEDKPSNSTRPSSRPRPCPLPRPLARRFRMRT
jgi:hypothetical protein